MPTLLITGTDTGVGKTWVGRALAHALVAAGRRVVAIKPVETGCSDATALHEDGALLAAATGQTEPLAALHRLAGPLVPLLDAGGEDESLDLDALVLRIETLAAGAEVVLVEGLGGLLTPITWEWTAVDVARILGAAALVVGVDRQSTINHALLTLSALELAGLEPTGLVLTPSATADDSTATVGPAIARLAGLDRIISVPRQDDPASAVPAMAPILDWMGLTR